MISTEIRSKKQSYNRIPDYSRINVTPCAKIVHNIRPGTFFKNVANFAVNGVVGLVHRIKPRGTYRRTTIDRLKIYNPYNVRKRWCVGNVILPVVLDLSDAVIKIH